MSGSASAYPPRAPVGGACAAKDGTGAVRRAGSPPSVQSGTQVPFPPSWSGWTSVVSGWPLRDFLELGALPSAVPCARYHCRQVLWEWRLTGLAMSPELLVSELVTNAITASRSVGSDYPIRLWLLSDAAQVLIVVWDASPHLPVRADVSADAETGRGLLLVEMISDQWGSCVTPPCGKTVWALTASP
jgi:anti-sigma regulatory factor (Ser/Thr protein kinase)